MSGHGNNHGDYRDAYRDAPPAHDHQIAPVPFFTTGNSSVNGPDGSVPPPLAWRIFRAFFIAVLGLAFMAAASLLVLYNHLGEHSLHVRSLIPYIEKAINLQLNEIHVRLDSVILRREPGETAVQVRLLGMRLLQPDGVLVAETPEAGLDIDVQALMRGETALEEITFYSPQLALLYDSQKGFSLSFSKKKEGSPPDRTGDRSNDRPVLRGGVDQGATIADEQLVVRKLASIFDALQKYRKTGSSLKRFRVTDAELYFSQGGKHSEWTIPGLTINLSHETSESQISGTLSILTRTKPLTVNFEARQDRDGNILKLNIENFQPSYILPKIGYSGVAGLAHFPISAITTVRLSQTGQLKSADAIVKLSEGDMFFPGEKLEIFKVRNSTIRVSYLNETDEMIKIEPSVLRWNGNEAVIKGQFSPLAKENGWEKGQYLLIADNIRVDARLFGLPPAYAGQWIAKGTFDLRQHRIRLADFLYKYNKAQIRMTGNIYRTNDVPDLELGGTVSGIDLELLKRLWNNNIAPETLQWIGENLRTARLGRGTFRVDIPHTAYDYLNKHNSLPDKSLDLKLVANNIHGHYLKDMPPFFAAESTMHLTGQYFSLYANKIKTHLRSSKSIRIRNFKFQVDLSKSGDDLEGLYEFDVSARNAALIEYLGLPALGILNPHKYKRNSVRGNAKGHFKLKIPFRDELTAQDVAVKGYLDLKNLARKKMFGSLDLTGGTVRLSVSPKALEARGKIYINRVPANLTWQHIYGAGPGKQPPLHLTTMLTGKGQKKLGIDTGKILVGDIPVKISLERLDRKKPVVKIHADITNARFNLPSLFWTKLPGQSAQVQFEVVQGRKKALHLRELAIFGEDLHIEGDISLDSGNRLKSFRFPRFTLNLLTNIKVSGKMRRTDNVLVVNATGTSFDARPFFRKLFSASRKEKTGRRDRAGKVKGKRRNRAARLRKKRRKKGASQKEGLYGIDIRAKIRTLIGHNEATARDVVINMKKRGKRLLSLTSHGTIKNSSPVSVNLVVGKKNQRFLVSETTNTGEALKLIGIYSKMVGGQGSLQVNLDAPGQADETGTLWLKRFAIVGDDVVHEVLTHNQTRIVSEDEKKRGTKSPTILAFDRLKAKFSTGNGQMILHEAYVNGPLLGATLRGKVDFRVKKIALGGTYVPLFGLNSSLKAIPILGDIVVGRNGEGIFGITYGIQGSMSNPTVLVNPLSLITPGIFRQIMEFQTPDMQTISRSGKKQGSRRKKRRPRKKWQPPRE